jgi:dipeptidyl aminopeptidase/acylaminoacyl peptidase
MRFHQTCCALAFVVTLGAAQRGITPEDYFAFETISDAHIAPGGKQVVYTLTTVDRQKNRRDTSVWMVAVDGRSAPRRLTAEGVNSSSPRWSPDGSRIAFLSARSTGAAADDPPRAQIWMLTLSGGEAQALTHLKNGAGAFQWSPDGMRLVVVSRTGPSDNAKPSERKSDVRHYTHISYKFNDTGWYDDKRSHLWIVNAAAGGGVVDAAKGSGVVNAAAGTGIVDAAKGSGVVNAAPGSGAADAAKGSGTARGRLPLATIGTIPTRNGRPIPRASLSSPTAPAKSTTGARIKTSG